MSEILNDGWKLESLKIEFQNWGDYKGKYVGKVKFTNKDEEAFMFNLTPDDTQDYINLVSKKLVQSASHLGSKLLSSLDLIPAPQVINLLPNQE